ncbi:MAG: lipoprotein-releasing system ATP-binding protein LolD [Rickettsiales bacterium]|nr:lipoprotein-releasing system ATP-binding protein LolD [Rickettsiales bacterium]|tara:strand:+ start:349 stop:1041 length:693 start_codon:yes stop_codon:yes gene_type:complete
MTNQTQIAIANVMKQYPIGKEFFTALKGINLEIKSGEFSGIVGPSGSGKTTLLNLIGCLDIVTEGSINVLNNDVTTLSHENAAKLRNEAIGFIFQTYNLLPVYTVFENVEFPLLLLNINAKKRTEMVLNALDWIGLADKAHVRPNQLSGGQCQRVSIARAIVKKPKLILADEPTANLDSENSFVILDMMKKMNNELGTTFVFSTHDERVIKSVNRVITLKDGQIFSDKSK